MTRHLLIASAALAALSLAACGQPADQSATAPAERIVPDANPAATIPTLADEASAPDFSRMAAQSDMLEIQSSQLAGERAQDSEVKAFAQMMVDAHTQTTQNLKTAIESADQSVILPTVPDEDVADELRDLREAAVTEFDREYIDLQVDTHQKTLNLMQRYARDGDVPTLQAFAAATAPTIQQHLDQATALQTRLNSAN